MFSVGVTCKYRQVQLPQYFEGSFGLDSAFIVKKVKWKLQNVFYGIFLQITKHAEIYIAIKVEFL